MKFRSATNKDIKEVTNLIYNILKEYGLKTDPDKTDLDLLDIELNYSNRNGAFDLLIDKQDNILATVGLYNIDDETCELRKMYLKKQERGKGLGKKILNHALARAGELGYKKVILETASVLKEAIELYKNYGFERYYPDHLAERCDQAYYLMLHKDET